jgi:MoxR-like ATPase
MRLNEAKEIIKRLYEADRSIVVYLEGAPGIGKSSVVKEAAKELGVECKIVELVTKKPTSFFIPEPEKDGKGFREIINFSILPKDPDSKGILFLDEFPSAPQIVQAAVHDLILDRRLGEYTLPEGWMIVLAGNRAGENILNAFLPATINRIVKIEIEYDEKDFVDYAVNHNYEPETISFFMQNKHLIARTSFENFNGEPFTSPRSIEKADKLIKIFGKNHPKIAELLKGVLGDAAFDFVAFIQDEMPKVEDVLNGKVEWNSLPQSKKHYVVAQVALNPEIKKIEKLMDVVDAEFKMVLISMVAVNKAFLPQILKSTKIMKAVEELKKIIGEVRI